MSPNKVETMSVWVRSPADWPSSVAGDRSKCNPSWVSGVELDIVVAMRGSLHKVILSMGMRNSVPLSYR